MFLHPHLKRRKNIGKETHRQGDHQILKPLEILNAWILNLILQQRKLATPEPEMIRMEPLTLKNSPKTNPLQSQRGNLFMGIDSWPALICGKVEKILKGCQPGLDPTTYTFSENLDYGQETLFEV